MSRVVLDQVTKKYGETFAVRAVDLDIQEGEFLTLLGPSGCGKTTTLRMIAGFVSPTSGTVYLGDEDVTFLPTNKRGIGMVFQDYALFPHMTIGENIAFGLAERRVDKATISKRVKELLDMVRLSTVEDRYPPELSGGQQQRIAVARAVAYAPRVLLMDEPLGALDLKLREAMQGEIRQIQQRLGTTTVYVTHDQTEAMHMSDRIVVMKDGLIEQMGSAEEIYDRPQSRFVADFIGQINLLDADVVGHEGGFCVIDIDGARVRVQQAPAEARGKVTAGLRPQHLKIATPGTASEGLNRLSGRILNRIFSGNLSHVEIELTGGQRVTVETSPHHVVGATDNAIEVHWSPEHGCVLTR